MMASDTNWQHHGQTTLRLRRSLASFLVLSASGGIQVQFADMTVEDCD